MDYTQSANNMVSLITGFRMHQNLAVPTTRVTKGDLNSIHWELLEVIKAGGQTPLAFNENNPASYSQILAAILQLSDASANAVLSGAAGGNTITATATPATLTPKLRGLIRLTIAATNTGPATLNTGGTALPLVRWNGDALVAGNLQAGKTYTLLPANGQLIVCEPSIGVGPQGAQLATTLTAAGVIDVSKDVQRLDTSGGAFIASLPPSGSCSKSLLVIQWSAGLESPTVDADGSETIDGGLSIPFAFAAPTPGFYPTLKLMPLASGGWVSL